MISNGIPNGTHDDKTTQKMKIIRYSEDHSLNITTEHSEINPTAMNKIANENQAIKNQIEYSVRKKDRPELSDAIKREVKNVYGVYPQA